MRKMLTTLTLMLAIGFTAGPDASAQIINGSFEPDTSVPGYLALGGGSTAIPGWVTTDSGVEWFNVAAYGAGAAAHGDYALDIANTVYSAGGIQQTFPTVPGQTYTIDFMLGTSQSSGRNGTCEIVVTADAQSQTFTAVNHNPIILWEPKAFSFTADDASATLTFRCLQNAFTVYANIDAVGAQAAVDNQAQSWGAVKSLFR